MSVKFRSRLCQVVNGLCVCDLTSLIRGGIVLAGCAAAATCWAWTGAGTLYRVSKDRGHDSRLTFVFRFLQAVHASEIFPGFSRRAGGTGGP